MNAVQRRLAHAQYQRQVLLSRLQSPQVTVVVNAAAGQKVSVDGAVNQAGVFELTGRTGLAEVVARAHGPSRTPPICTG